MWVLEKPGFGVLVGGNYSTGLHTVSWLHKLVTFIQTLPEAYHTGILELRQLQ